MLILGIDTSGKSGGVTLAQGDANGFRVLQSAPIVGGTFSAQLVPTISGLLSKHGFAAKDIGGFAVASGPGSFTGLRVGLSAVKGLAEVLGTPIVTVSVLEALAVLSREHGRVVAALDAGREEVFVGVYDLSPTGSALFSVTRFSATKSEEKLASREEFLELAKNMVPACVVVSDESLAALSTRAHSNVQLVERPGSEAIAEIGLKKLLAGETVTTEALDANYLRRSDAEILFKGPR